MAVEGAAEHEGLLQPRARTAVLVAAGVLTLIVARNLFVAAHQVLGWALAASLLALFVTPVIRTLDTALPRALAAVLSFLLLIAAIIGVSYVYSTGVRNEVDRLSEQGPQIAAAIEQRDDRIGTFASDIGLERQVADVTQRLADGVGSSGDSLREATMSAPSYLVTMILTIFLVIYGRRLVNGALGQLPERRREMLDDALTRAAHRAQVYVGASLVQAVVNGAAVYTAATLIDAPAAGLLALFAATLAMLPYLGVALGWSPLILFAFGLVSLDRVALIVLVAAGIQAVEALVWRPLVDARSLHLGPLIPLVTAVLGFAIYGVGGALCAAGAVVGLVALADQLTGDEHLPTPLDSVA